MFLFQDPVYDAQLLRTIGHATYGGAELGECWATATKLRSGERDAWLAAWSKLAERSFAEAEASLIGGHPASAHRAFLRASNYFRTSYVFHLEHPLPAVVRDMHARHRHAFELALTATREPVERLAIPFEDATLPAYFCAAKAGGRRPLVISVGGYDSTAEESYFWNAVAANTRGYHALLFDGPGQGAMLIERGAVFRPDYETVIAAVIDAALVRPYVDPTKIALVGVSFGGYLASGAAARDGRIAACILDPAQIGLYRAILERLRLSASQKARLPGGPAWLVRILKWRLARLAKQPTGGWALRRGMLTHGVATPWDYLLDSRRYDQPETIGDIRCPTLVCDAENDEVSAFAKRFFDELTCEKKYLRFGSDEGAGDHCEMGNRALYHERTFDWLDEIFARPTR